MASHKPNPAARAAGRARDGFNSLAALNDPQIAQALPAFQASFRVSRLGLSPSHVPDVSLVWEARQ
jgi:hypothetical protein